MKGQMIRSFLFERRCSVLGIGHFRFVPRSGDVHGYSLLRSASSANCLSQKWHIFTGMYECLAT